MATTQQHKRWRWILRVPVVVVVVVVVVLLITLSQTTDYDHENDVRKEQGHPSMNHDRNNNKNNKDKLLQQKPGLLSIPLVSHHTQIRRHNRKRRRLLQLQQQSQQSPSFHNSSIDTGYGENFDLGLDRPRFSTYPRWRQLLSTTDATLASNATTTTTGTTRKTAATTTSGTAALYMGYGTHYADVWCGHPVPHRVTVIVDTGSTVTAWPCEDCPPDRCGRLDRSHTDGWYRTDQSTTYAKVTCDPVHDDDENHDDDNDDTKKKHSSNNASSPSSCLLGYCQDDTHTCAMGVAYQEGSHWTAVEVTDQCYIGGWHNGPIVDGSGVDSTLPSSNNKNKQATDGTTALSSPPSPLDGLDPHTAADRSFPLRFGCQTSITGQFRTQLADGIMGMNVGPGAVWQQLYQARQIARRAFALCLTRTTRASKGGTVAGALTLGGTDVRWHKEGQEMVYSTTAGTMFEEEDEAGDPQYRPVTGNSFFSVRMVRVYLQGGIVAGSDTKEVLENAELPVIPLNVSEFLMNDGQVILDSGTTDTYFIHHLKKPFMTAWQNLVGTPYSNRPVTLTDAQLDALPTVFLQFRGHDRNKQHSEPLSFSSLAGRLDPTHPYDVLLAIPPTHYMEYHADTRRYVPGLYFDEQSGTVLGANAMLQHNVLFDVQGGYLGWVESACDYDALVEPLFGTRDALSKDVDAKNELRQQPPANQPGAKRIVTDPALVVSLDVCATWGCRLGLLIGAIVVLAVAWCLNMKRRFVQRRRWWRWRPVSISPNHASFKRKQSTLVEGDDRDYFGNDPELFYRQDSSGTPGSSRINDGNGYHNNTNGGIDSDSISSVGPPALQQHQGRTVRRTLSSRRSVARSVSEAIPRRGTARHFSHSSARNGSDDTTALNSTSDDLGIHGRHGRTMLQHDTMTSFVGERRIKRGGSGRGGVLRSRSHVVI